MSQVLRAVVAVLRANAVAVVESTEWKALNAAVRAKAMQAVLTGKPYGSTND